MQSQIYLTLRRSVLRKIYGLLFVSWASSMPSLPAQELPQISNDSKEQTIEQWIARLDASLESTWADREVVPAAQADDGEFLRRVYLDLIGRVPYVSEARAFLDDADRNKRTKLVRDLLATPAHARHAAALTRQDWFGSTDSDLRRLINADAVENWLGEQYAKNTPLDELTRKLLTASVAVGQRGRITNPTADRDTTEISNYYSALGAKPETIIANVTRTFLGVKLECAQCHDHPFAPYKQDQFWQLAAFFGEFSALSPISPSFVGPLLPQADLFLLDLPLVERTVTAQFLDGSAPEWNPKTTPREEFADWLVAPRNPYFARNMVNRQWAELFGIGLIDPIDEPSDDNEPSHPELLDLLTKCFIELNYDRKALIAVIVGTKAYQLTSRQTHESQADPRTLARANLRMLSGQQLYDSFLAATGKIAPKSMRENNFLRFGGDAARTEYNAAFGRLISKPTEQRSSILQALLMMNGQATIEQTDINKSRTLAAMLDAPFFDTAQRLETLFLATFTRLPTADERQRYQSFIDRAGTDPEQQKQALADIFWVLLNSPEFATQH